MKILERMKFAFMNDKQRYLHILSHYDELEKEYKKMNSETDPFLKETVLKKCVYMDLFQIGEHFNKFSKEVQNQIDPKDVRGIVDIRNKIGHAYYEVDPEIIEDTIVNECPRLISKLKELFE